MPQWLQESFSAESHFTWETLFLRLIAALVFGAIVALIYFLTHRRDETYQPTFLSTIVMLTILIALVTQVIGDSVAKAFSLVGALSIVRFRTVVQDTRDTAFVIFAVVLGMAVGSGNLKVATAGLCIAGLAAFLFRAPILTATAAAVDWSLTVRMGLGEGLAAIEEIVRNHAISSRLTAARTSRQGAAMEYVLRVRLLPKSSASELLRDLNQKEGVQNVELSLV